MKILFSILLISLFSYSTKWNKTQELNLSLDSLIELCDAKTYEDYVTFEKKNDDWTLTKYSDRRITFGKDVSNNGNYATSWIIKEINDDSFTLIYHTLGSDYSGKKEFKKFLKEALKDPRFLIDKSSKYGYELSYGDYKFDFIEKRGVCQVGKKSNATVLVYQIWIEKR